MRQKVNRKTGQVDSRPGVPAREICPGLQGDNTVQRPLACPVIR